MFSPHMQVLVHWKVRGLVVVLLFWGLGGCAAVRTKVHPVPPEQEREVRQILREAPGRSCSLSADWLDYARRADLNETQRLQAYLQTARVAFAGARRDDPEDTLIYRTAVEQVVTLWSGLGWKSLDFSASPDLAILSLSLRTNEAGEIDPRKVDELIAADRIEIRGLQQISRREGFGVPYVGWVDRSNPVLQGQPGVPQIGMVWRLNAVLTFRGRQAELQFFDTGRAEKFSWGKEKFALASNESAAVAYLISRGKNRAIDLRAMFFSDRYVNEARLLQFEPYDPDKIPVVFVHGLMSRPEAWTQALNGLLADPVIRKNYQFWFYLYPTGLPVWKSAALLRAELVRFDRELDRRADSRSNEKILVGHSMGGLISSLLVREGGDPLWRQFSDERFEEIQVSPPIRETMRDLLFFGPRHDVSRVVFVATPHRGSQLALRPVAGFFANLIRLPAVLTREDRQLLLQAMRDDMRSVMVAPANSIRFLRANSPLLLSILNLPMRGNVAVHTIVGDRGRGGPVEFSSDGVVPWWSSHLETAVSEKVVPSGHGANEHPEGIEEIRRILREAIEKPRPGVSSGSDSR